MKSVNPKLEIVGVLPTMAEANTIVTKQSLNTLSEMFGEKVFDNMITKSTVAPKSVELGRYIPQSEKIGMQYRQLAAEVIERCQM